MTDQVGNLDGYTTVKCNVPVIRMYDGLLMNSELIISASIDVSNNSNERESDKLINMIKFWIEESLDGIILVNATDEIDLKISLNTKNNVMYCPGVPTDSMVALLVYAKLVNIVENKIRIFKFELESTDFGTVTTLCGDTTTALPLTTEYSNIQVYDIKPWWLRSDGYTVEFPYSDKDFDEAYPQKDTYDILTDFNNEYNEQVDDEEISELQEILEIKKKWKPKLIN